jgi:hypothetical protein
MNRILCVLTLTAMSSTAIAAEDMATSGNASVTLTMQGTSQSVIGLMIDGQMDNDGSSTVLTGANQDVLDFGTFDLSAFNDPTVGANFYNFTDAGTYVVGTLRVGLMVGGYSQGDVTLYQQNYSGPGGVLTQYRNNSMEAWAWESDPTPADGDVPTIAAPVNILSSGPGPTDTNLQVAFFIPDGTSTGTSSVELVFTATPTP